MSGGNEEVYKVLLEIKQDVGEMKGDLRALSGIPERVAALEKKGSFASGWVHAIGLIISAIVAFVVSNWSAMTHTK